MPDSEMKELFIKNLKRILKEKNCMASELAQGINVRKSTVSNWMNGLSLPRMEKVNEICGFLGVERSELFKDELNDLTDGITELAHTVSEMRNQLLDGVPKTRQEADKQKEAILLEQYRQLNTEGQTKAVEAVENLTYNPKYAKEE